MKIEVNLPDNFNEKLNEHDIKIVIASALYDKRIVSLGYAAESVGLDRRTLYRRDGEVWCSCIKIN
jgi:predicted HTH domain antitoxin